MNLNLDAVKSKVREICLLLYDRSKIVRDFYNISLKEACVELGFLTAEKFDEVFHPEQMA